MKLSTLVFGGGISTLGLSVVTAAIREAHGDSVEITECRPNDLVTLKESDVIFVSLFWYENLYQYLNFLNTAHVNPKRKKPMLIIGGIAAINIRILQGFFHYCVLGDGELVAADLIRAIKDGSDPAALPGVIADGDFDTRKELLTNPVIPARSYVEMRDNRTARIELARGCKWKCPFCQLAWTKPYREQPVPVVEHLLKQTPTKAVGLFAPDRTGYSGFAEVEQICAKLGKHNTAEDARLDALLHEKIVSKVKFGVEGFAARTRKIFKKVPSDKQLIKGFRHIFQTLRTPKGKHISVATIYMIGDLPGEGPDDVLHFWEVLREADQYCTRKFTLFLTLNSFSPKPFTPMERVEIHPYNDWNKQWLNSPRFPNMTIARRGGLIGPSKRISHMITCRGDERLGRVLFYLANDGAKILRSREVGAGKAVEKILKKAGIEPESMWEEWPESEPLPHHQFTIQELEPK